MPTIDRRRVLRAMRPSPWDFSNQVLYDLCRAHPAHDDESVIIAKVLLIGRAYSAAIERRKNKKQGEGSDAFYFEKVGPMLRESQLDRWIAGARASRPGTRSALATLVKVHGFTTDLFRGISGLDKRALASKYLHFHVPNLFYIYDSRAAEAMREFSGDLPRPSRSGDGDDEYRKFAERCQHLRDLCAQQFSLDLLPRHVDNLLLRVNER
ncbi:MAG: hypothetical protein ABI868_18080 [Acidobacteriota bacterium]